MHCSKKMRELKHFLLISVGFWTKKHTCFIGEKTLFSIKIQQHQIFVFSCFSMLNQNPNRRPRLLWRR